MLKALRQISTELLTRNPWWEYRKDVYQRPDGEQSDYHYVHTPGSVMVIPITSEGKLILVKQYRYLNQRIGLEFVGGGVKAGKSALESAKDELFEEAGFIAGELMKIGEFNPMNGVTDEICNIFVARSLKRTAANPDSTEEFEVKELEPANVSALIRDGSIWDGMSLAAFAVFELRKNEFLLTTKE